MSVRPDDDADVAARPDPSAIGELIALLGGTFDPIHIGHLRAATEVAQALRAQVRLLPARIPPHRPQPVASAGQRLQMLQIALAGSEGLCADDRELRREGPSYSFDTLSEFRREFGPQRPLALIVGADAFAAFNHWHRWQEIFGLAHVVVLERPGAATAPDWPAELKAEVDARHCDEVSELSRSGSGCLCQLAIPALAISATSVRAALARGASARWLVPDAVLEHIERTGLYRDRAPQQPDS